MALREIGYKINDADKMSAVQDNSVNLFAWHPQGPLEDAAVQKIIAS